MKIEVDYTEMVEEIKDLKHAIKKAVDAWYSFLESTDIRKSLKKIRIGDSNNYLKYHKIPMKRRRWLKE